MRRILIFLFCLSSIGSTAQEKDTAQDNVSLDQLQVPSSPAFTLLGISPESIERPKNPTDFALSLNNATQSFSSIPKNYAVEFSPYWLAGGKKARYADFANDNPWKNIRQTAIISIGTTSKISKVDSLEFNQVGFALKFSIAKGHFSDDFIEWNDSMHALLKTIAEGQNLSFDNLLKSDSLYSVLLKQSDSLGNLIRQPGLGVDMRKQIKEEMERSNSKKDRRLQLLKSRIDSIQKEGPELKQQLAELKALVSERDFKRYGFKADVALGTAFDFPGQKFESGHLSKAAGWFTTGWECESGLSLLGVLKGNLDQYDRILNDTGLIVHNISVFSYDYGGRAFWDITGKFTMSFECLWRKAIYNKQKFIDSSITQPAGDNMRYVFSVNYKVGKNKNIAFAFGKDFERSFNDFTKGNMIAALNLIMGFGSNRPFGGSDK